MEENEELFGLTEDIQKECYQFADQLLNEMHKTRKGRKDFLLQDSINIFFYHKLAEIELRLCEIERRTTISEN